MKQAWLDLILGLAGWVLVVFAIASGDWTQATFWLLFVLLLTVQGAAR